MHYDIIAIIAGVQPNKANLRTKKQIKSYILMIHEYILYLKLNLNTLFIPLLTSTHVISTFLTVTEATYAIYNATSTESKGSVAEYTSIYIYIKIQ